MKITKLCTGLSVFLGGTAGAVSVSGEGVLSGEDRLTAAVMNSQPSGSENISRLTEKRYHQLITQMNFYNLDFDPRKFWGYGCNCFHLSDRPMTDGLGLGVVDELDTACKKYKECLKCAAMEHGNACVGELVKYKFEALGMQVQCKNKAGTCERSLCECDNLLARTHVLAADAWDSKYHTFWGGWDFNSQCIHPKSTSGRQIVDRQCCNNDKRTSHFSLYATDRQECCSNGEVRNIGSC